MNKILIANRGEIALRIMRTCRQLNVSTVAVYSDADRHALHVSEADEAFHIGPAPAEQSYLNSDNVLAAALASGADGVHPGYGFLSENPNFAAAVQAAGLTWIGPSPAAMHKMASKISAREIAQQHDVPVIPACTLAAGEAFDAGAIAAAIGLPLLIKASAGGGGIGMREVHALDELAGAIDETRNQAQRQFGSGDVLLERFITGGRHVEVQVVGDQHGKLLHLYERDCSAQRRRQKLLEEAPAPDLSPDLRTALHAAALRLATAVNYQGVGTVEFLVENDGFFLLEMNTRLQVEHGVTEAVSGLDLVELQLQIARGQPLGLEQADICCQGHAIEARIYAEDPAAGFLPATGPLAAFSWAAKPWLRVDSGVARGSHIGHHYDGMLCKLIVHADNRDEATHRLQCALGGLRLAGIKSNQRLLYTVLTSPCWQQGISTSTIENELSGLLATAEPASDQVDLLLVAATIWHFLHYPPAADQVPWPGAYQYERQSSFLLAGETRRLNWRWAGAGEYQFPELDMKATVLGRVGDDVLELEIAAQRQQFHIHVDGDSLWLWHRQLGNHELILQHGADHKADPGQGGHLNSHGPGLVLRLLVSEGQQVETDQALVVIESMKMESTLSAKRAGRIAEVAVAEGDTITSGQLLVRLELGDEGTA
jgi:3-methylcrotonyl-CoA carboxylase alpha subunit